MNVARSIIEFMTSNVLYLRSLHERGNSKRFIFLRVPCDPDNEEVPLPCLSKTQFPVCSCFAITIQKAQVQFLGEAFEID